MKVGLFLQPRSTSEHYCEVNIQSNGNIFIPEESSNICLQDTYLKYQLLIQYKTTDVIFLVMLVFYHCIGSSFPIVWVAHKNGLLIV